MTKYFIISLILIATILAFDGINDVVIADRDAVYPILNMELVEIPSEGTIAWIKGDAEIKKKGKKEYSKIRIETVVGEGDILWLKKDSEVKITFEDGSYILNEPPSTDIYITFRIKNNDNKTN
jgi:hypothetical protein